MTEPIKPKKYTPPINPATKENGRWTDREMPTNPCPPMELGKKTKKQLREQTADELIKYFDDRESWAREHKDYSQYLVTIEKAHRALDLIISGKSMIKACEGANVNYLWFIKRGMVDDDFQEIIDKCRKAAAATHADRLLDLNTRDDLTIEERKLEKDILIFTAKTGDPSRFNPAANNAGTTTAVQINITRDDF